MSGTFIVFDGGPGSGKGTMIRRTFDYVYGLSKKYDNILITDEPTNGPFGKRVRELFKLQKDPFDLAEDILQAFYLPTSGQSLPAPSPKLLPKNLLEYCSREYPEHKQKRLLPQVQKLRDKNIF